MSADLPDRPRRETRTARARRHRRDRGAGAALAAPVSAYRADVGVPATGPLAGLAARATFDDMAAALTSAPARVEPTLVAIELPAPAPPTAAAALRAGPAGLTAASGRDGYAPRPAVFRAARPPRPRRRLRGGGARPLLTPGSRRSLEVMSVDARSRARVLWPHAVDDVANLATASTARFPASATSP